MTLMGFCSDGLFCGRTKGDQNFLSHNNNVVYMLSMAMLSTILNEREARDTKAVIECLDKALSSDGYFQPLIEGIPVEIVPGIRNALAREKAELEAVLSAYLNAKSGDYEALQKKSGCDLGVTLIVARIARGLSQKELARRLGMREQQIQRYESDRYKSISLSNYMRVARVLGVKPKAEIATNYGNGWSISNNIDPADVRKVTKHAKEYGWIKGTSSPENGDELKQFITDHYTSYGSPTLLRTGLNVTEDNNDLLLVSWKSRVAQRAEKYLDKVRGKFTSLNYSWLVDLVKLSVFRDGPKRARELLLDRGIILVAEPQIPGLKLDGAAFLMENVPVIGLTLRRDTVDNFWFTLMHEIGHVYLHYSAGLMAGFFDDVDKKDIDEVEQEANIFAENLLIPSEIWRKSPVRLSKSHAVIDRFADSIGIAKEIVYGRLQKERDNYKQFSAKIGRGRVRSCLFENSPLTPQEDDEERMLL